MKIQLRHPQAKIPTRANPWDAGADLYSVESGYLLPGERKLFDTGVAIELPDSYVGYVCPRSGLAVKKGISIVNSPGVVDSGYRGTLLINLINLGEANHWVEVGDRIAQLIVQQVTFPEFVVSDELSSSVRGINGWGSSGA